MACEETISDTAMPAPKRFACRRTNQLPIPASGARITRLGTRREPRVQASSRRGAISSIMDRASTTDGRRRGDATSVLAVTCVQQAQPGQCQQVVDLLDL